MRNFINMNSILRFVRFHALPPLREKGGHKSFSLLLMTAWAALMTAQALAGQGPELRFLASDAGPLTPSFSPGGLNYTVRHDLADITLWPMKSAAGAELEIRSGAAGGWTKLSRGGQLAYGGSPDHSFVAQIKSDGKVSVPFGWVPLNQPDTLENVVAVAAGARHITALKADGTVVSWGGEGVGGDGSWTPAPADLVNVSAISAAADFNLALKQDGTVTGWGENTHGQLTLPAGLNQVAAICAQAGPKPWCLALRRDGTVTAWGAGVTGSLPVPAGLQGVVAITGLVSAPGVISGMDPALLTKAVALLDSGRVVKWDVVSGAVDPETVQLHNVAAISRHLALRGDGSLQDMAAGSPVSVVSGAVAALEDGIAVKSDGTAWMVNGAIGGVARPVGGTVAVRPAWFAATLTQGANPVQVRVTDGPAQAVYHLEITRAALTDFRFLAADGPAV